MPFSALLDNEPVISLLMSDAQWEQAKSITKQQEDRLLVGHSRLPGFARTSPLGLRHFAHRKGYAPDYEWAESAEHQALKAELVRAIAARGWKVDAEVPSGPERDWIADVLAERDGERIAFEVQWSKQSAAEYVRRTQRYAEAGIECVWLIRHMPDLSKADITPELREAFSKVAAFQLQETERLSALIAAKEMDYPSAMLVSVATVSKGVDTGRRILSVEDLARAVLDGKIRSRPVFSTVVYSAACPRCRSSALYWYVEGVGKRTPFHRPEQDPLILAGVAKAGLILDPHQILAKIEVDDHGSARSKQVPFSCPHCAMTFKPSLEATNLSIASKTGRGLRFEIPDAARWREFIERWQIKTRNQLKLNG